MIQIKKLIKIRITLVLVHIKYTVCTLHVMGLVHENWRSLRKSTRTDPAG